MPHQGTSGDQGQISPKRPSSGNGPEEVQPAGRPEELSGPYARQELQRHVVQESARVASKRGPEQPVRREQPAQRKTPEISSGQTAPAKELMRETSEGIDGGGSPQKFSGGTPDVVTLEEQKTGWEKFQADLEVVVRELGISKRAFVASCVSVVAVAAALVLAIVFWGTLFGEKPAGAPSAPPAPHEEAAQVVADSAPLTMVDRPSHWIDPSLYSSVLLGHSSNALSLQDASFLLGESVTPLPPTTLVYALDDLRRAVQFLEVDVLSLLQQSVDRPSALAAHLALGQSLAMALERHQATLRQDYDALQTAFADAAIKKADGEQRFFFSVKQLLPEQTDAALSAFITSGREAFELKVRARALSKAFDLYALVLPRLTKRIRDMELNRDALLSGVQVTDVQGSDLRLILQEEGLE